MATSPAMRTPIYDELLRELALVLENEATTPAAETDSSPKSDSSTATERRVST